MRTTVRLPPDLLAAAKEKAHREGTTLTALIERGLRLSIMTKANKSRKLSPPRISCATGGVLPGIDITRTSQLLDDEDVERFLESTR